MKLYFSRNYNPRLAVAAARFLKSPVEFEFASPFSPEQSEKFLKLNPNRSVPILVEGDKTFWEADAIACRLGKFIQSRLHHILVARGRCHSVAWSRARNGLGRRL
jgi:glutathione S-transferase